MDQIRDNLPKIPEPSSSSEPRPQTQLSNVSSKSLQTRRDENALSLQPASEVDLRKALLVLAHEIASTGKMDPDAMDGLINARVKDLKAYPLDAIEHAIQRHREASPFWPALSELQPHITAIVRSRERKRDWLKYADRSWISDKEEKEINEPQEVRTAAVAEWKDGGAQKLMDLGTEAERERFGTKTSEKPVIDSKDQPWHDVNELRASALRINAHDEALGKRPAFNLKPESDPANPLQPNTDTEK